jgi:hypothetical protein
MSIRVKKPVHEVSGQMDLMGFSPERVEQPGRFVPRVAISEASKYSAWLLSRVVFNWAAAAPAAGRAMKAAVRATGKRGKMVVAEQFSLIGGVA